MSVSTPLIEDGLSGFVLVCLVLTLFLQLRVAVWAGVGYFYLDIGCVVADADAGCVAQYAVVIWLFTGNGHSG